MQIQIQKVKKNKQNVVTWAKLAITYLREGISNFDMQYKRSELAEA